MHDLVVCTTKHFIPPLLSWVRGKDVVGIEGRNSVHQGIHHGRYLELARLRSNNKPSELAVNANSKNTYGKHELYVSIVVGNEVVGDSRLDAEVLPVFAGFF